MIAGVVLAAGLSSRMGQPKQLLDWRGTPLVRHVVLQALAAPLDRVVVVVHPTVPGLLAALADLPIVLVEQSDPAQGQGDSLRLGIAALPEAVSAALVLLGDQPFVTGALIGELIAAAQSTAASIVAPLIAGRRANPVLFKRRWFAALGSIHGDHGARQLIADHPAELLLVPIDAPLAGADVDTLADYQRLLLAAGS
ncbi:MAG: nucleotidyltransferase family protein [Herpetosiphonaceae bacterium]|nr:nucleotidyltransferase family protein [Herpetosiphonaceae bacterium]